MIGGGSVVVEKQKGIQRPTMKKAKTPPDDKNRLAKLIAAVVRNQMEDFHCAHLTDAQMKELNPIIRNAIYTALLRLEKTPAFMAAYYALYVPAYWEDCEEVTL